jgi:predicted amino acid dehydrogenase
VVERGLIQPSTTDRESLIRLGEELISRTGVVVVSTDVDAVLPQADIVVCCTSSTEQFVRGDNLSAGVIVCDMSRPSNVSPDLAGSRPDVMVLNGGVVRLPQESPLGFSTFLPPGHAYACMAETIMMAMDHRYHDASLGFDLSLPWISELEQLGRELDFEVVLDRQEPNNENEALDVSSRIVLPQETFLLSTG